MSYCRFSSDGWRSDVYVYESEAGYQIHVASNRFVHPGGKASPEIDISDAPSFVRTYQESTKWVDECEMVEIGLGRDGESYLFDSPIECAEMLLKVRESGYHVPQFAINDLLSEGTG